jgi:hypothetical protein
MAKRKLEAKPCEECYWFVQREGWAFKSCENKDTIFFHPRYNREEVSDPCGPSGKLWEKRK